MKDLNIYVKMVLVFAGIAFIGGFIYGMTKNDKAVWHKNRIEFESVPVSVSWDHDKFQDFNSTIGDAIDLVNSRAGCPVLRIVPASEPADIRIIPLDLTPCTNSDSGMDVGGSFAMATYYCPNRNKGGHVEIQVREMVEISTAFRGILHELRHALGLGGDSHGHVDEYGAGAPLVYPAKDSDPPEHFFISNKDAKALNEKFCKGL